MLWPVVNDDCLPGPAQCGDAQRDYVHYRSVRIKTTVLMVNRHAYRQVTAMLATKLLPVRPIIIYLQYYLLRDDISLH